MPSHDSESAAGAQSPAAFTATVPAPEAPPAPGHSARRAGARGRGRDLTQGSIPKNLWWLAWPQMIEGVLNVADQIVDIIWAGLIGVSTIAGVGIAQTFRQFTMTGRMGLDTAMRAQVSRAIGAGDGRLANHLALQGFTLSGTFTITMAVIGVLFTVPFMRILGIGEDVVAAAAGYVRLQFVGFAGLALRQMSGAALQAAGDAITPMKATTLTRIGHIVMSPFFIFGLLFFPEMGIEGAALADVIAQFFGATWNFRALFRGTSRLHLTLKGYRPDFPVLWRTTKIGIPASISGMERSTAQLVLLALVTNFGTVALAAFGLTRRAENLAQLGSQGLGQSSGVLVGQNLGAGRPDRARQTVYWAMGYVLILGTIKVFLMLAFATAIVTVFTRDAELVPLAADWLRILAFSVVFLGASQVFAQSFNIAGETIIPMMVSLLTFWIIEVPLAIMLSGLSKSIGLFGLSFTFPTILDLGQFGIAWAITIAMMVRIVAFVPFFTGSRWLKKRVI